MIWQLIDNYDLFLHEAANSEILQGFKDQIIKWDSSQCRDNDKSENDIELQKGLNLLPIRQVKLLTNGLRYQDA